MAQESFRCPQCGAEVRPEDNFCESCGAPLKKAPPPKPPTPTLPFALGTKKALRTLIIGAAALLAFSFLMGIVMGRGCSPAPPTPEKATVVVEKVVTATSLPHTPTPTDTPGPSPTPTKTPVPTDTPTSTPTPEPTSIPEFLHVGEVFKTEGVWLVVSKVEISDERSFNWAPIVVDFRFSNHTGKPIYLQYSDADFYVIDNLERRYTDWEGGPSHSLNINDGEDHTFQIYFGIVKDQKSVLGKEVEYVIVVAKEFSRIENARWRFDIYR